MSSRRSGLNRSPLPSGSERAPNQPLRPAPTPSGGATSTIRVDDLSAQRIMGFKKKLRADKNFLREFYTNPIAVLDREVGIRIDPGSRIANELMATLRKKGEGGLIPPPEEFNCYILTWGKTCIVVAQPEAP